MSIKFTEDHEWIRLEGDDVYAVGITNYAQEQLGDIVFVELPDIDREVAQKEEACVIESVKAAGEIKSPAGGTVTEVNEALSDDPTLVNSDPMGEGWFYKIRISDAGELDQLMDENAYNESIEA